MRHLVIPVVAATLTVGAFALAAVTFVDSHRQRVEQIRSDYQSRQLLCIEEKNTRLATRALAAAVENILITSERLSSSTPQTPAQKAAARQFFPRVVKPVDDALRGLSRLQCRAVVPPQAG